VASEVVVRWKPKVHAELALIIVMVKGKIEPIVLYIGVSKLSCIICSHYIRAFHEVTKQRIATKGSHGRLTLDGSGLIFLAMMESFVWPF